MSRLPPSGELTALSSSDCVRTVALLSLATVLAGSAVRSLAAGTSFKRFDQSGIHFEYPASWFVTTKPLSNGVDPKYLFTVSTNPVRRTSKDLGPCLPGIAAQLPPNAVLAYLREDFSGRSRSLPRMQPRPRTFRLPRRTDNALCGFDRGVWVPFRSGGRALYLALYVGQRASASRAEMLARVVNEMRIDPR